MIHHHSNGAKKARERRRKERRLKPKQLHIFSEGPGGAGAYPSCHWAKGGRIHPGQVASRSQGRQTHTLTPRGNLACPIGLTACLWTVGGNWRTRRKPTQRTCKLHTERNLADRPGNRIQALLAVR
ncbi:hypothetical protein MHYP_G00090520 [Metynnis hypsauchen]